MRRTTSPFSLSLLDLLTSALGAVILLFVIVPKGGVGAATAQQAAVFFDTTTMQIHGVLPDSLTAKRAGDTLFALLVDYRAVDGPDVGGLEAQLAAERRRVAEAEAARRRALAEAEQASTATERAEAARRAAEAKARAEAAAASAAEARAERLAEAKPSKIPSRPTPSTPAPATRKPQPAYTGTLPSVPAAVSFELTWASKSDNVDLFVCQGNTCVYGERKRDKDIGQWDSGKSRNRLFGNDLRTNQEAVRQFDGVLPGTYTVYARLKESGSNRGSTKVDGLVYTKGPDGVPRGHTYTKTLKLGEPRTRLITVTLRSDGSFATR